MSEQNNYYLQFVNYNYHNLYHTVVNNLSQGVFVTSLEMSIGNGFNEQMRLVSEAVIYGNPHLFWAGQNVEVKYDNGRVIMSFPNNYPEGNYEDMTKEMNDIIDEVVSEASLIDDDMDKIYFVNKWLCTNIEGQNEYSNDNGNAYGALVRKVGRCEGFTKAMKLILDRLNIESIICIGDALSGGSRIPHSWIAIKYNDEYYGFDIAFNASMTVLNVPGVIYTFLNKSLLEIDHFPEIDYPICEKCDYLFWNLHNGNAEYLFDLQNADIVECENSFLSVHHLIDIEVDLYQENYELGQWILDNLSPLSIASNFTYRYSRALNVLQVFYINQ